MKAKSQPSQRYKKKRERKKAEREKIPINAREGLQIMNLVFHPPQLSIPSSPVSLFVSHDLPLQRGKPQTPNPIWPNPPPSNSRSSTSSVSLPPTFHFLPNAYDYLPTTPCLPTPYHAARNLHTSAASHSHSPAGMATVTAVVVRISTQL